MEKLSMLVVIVRIEPHQDTRHNYAKVKWENASKGNRQTGFVPLVHGLALVNDIL